MKKRTEKEVVIDELENIMLSYSANADYTFDMARDAIRIVVNQYLKRN